MSKVHICKAIFELREYLKIALEKRNKGLRAHIKSLVKEMNVHENKLEDCIEPEKEVNQYFS